MMMTVTMTMTEWYKELSMIKIILYILAFLLAIVVSWGITVGAIKLICLCFSLQFSWKIATGVWLILTLISGFLKNTIQVNK